MSFFRPSAPAQDMFRGNGAVSMQAKHINRKKAAPGRARLCCMIGSEHTVRNRKETGQL